MLSLTFKYHASEAKCHHLPLKEDHLEGPFHFQNHLFGAFLVALSGQFQPIPQQQKALMRPRLSIVNLGKIWKILHKI